jgi:hypothetical protein
MHFNESTTNYGFFLRKPSKFRITCNFPIEVSKLAIISSKFRLICNSPQLTVWVNGNPRVHPRGHGNPLVHPRVQVI